MSTNIRLSGIVKESIVDGPGIRYVIFTQGCEHGCMNCHNPQTHDKASGYLKDVNEIIEEINSIPYYNGVTFSGGEPLLQVKACNAIVQGIKANHHIIVYTGYLFEELIEKVKYDMELLILLQSIDIIIDGRFEESKKTLDLKFRGSNNQRIIDSKQSMIQKKVIIQNL